ncbi:CheR family methyltransferase [Bosea sp. 685]|uniref:CheR family methyltransferase n=1 Tax=Bosea sp. 685 TaxID=3080057 RepID=UPI0028933F80|nr:CheR family methyltransferase [Bosea sp. 685]WNJ93535.1 CheR family methyltransferase [Bosea sp. 685]
MPDTDGLAFVLVQHLDPNHPSMIAELLSSHTSLTVREASEGVRLERGHLYVIAPGTSLSVVGGALHASVPQQRHGARLPFDFLLQSLAKEYGSRCIAIVLSGTGADGSVGLKAIKSKGGIVFAQDPEEAGYDGMPRSAIATGGVDRILLAAEIPEALLESAKKIHDDPAMMERVATDKEQSWLADVIDLLKNNTRHDFTFYKPGTLLRRIERRRGLAGIEAGDMLAYLDVLRQNPAERDLLAKDLLINVTSFFRDSKTFSLLAESIIPEMVSKQPADRPLRIWIAGCSTGEEAYSLAMLFREQITAAKSNVKLQLFASDIDADAVLRAQEGLYPNTIEDAVSADRLARFFKKEGQNYRILPDVRGMVVFTVQDLLADPPFSRLDMISCRNVLIYLQPEAQTKILSLFHFALREGGTLLLGSSETVSHAEGRFAVIAKDQRIYRHIGRSHPGDARFSGSAAELIRLPQRTGQGQAVSRQSALAELCKRAVIEAYAPAAVLINSAHECLYSLGPTDLYLHVAPGYPSHDILAMAPEGVRTKLRAAIHKATQSNAAVKLDGIRPRRGPQNYAFSIAVLPLKHEGEALFLVSFIDVPKHDKAPVVSTSSTDAPRVGELEQELDAARAELKDAIRNLEISSEEQRAINEEALSVNEEFQSTNEELLTSKEELQSLNEELTALNGQLQETLERQRTTSDDLQNVLYSTDVATVFLDRDLKIRFFTPATKALFKIIPGDVGRPLEDLNSLAVDSSLPVDARTVLQTLAPLERRIEARNGVWFVRRIMPYRAHDNSVEGVVITFTDITEQKKTARALDNARKQAELANVAKSRFLAAASHDLRQPLQGLALLQGLLAKVVEGDKAKTLVARLSDTVDAMSGMLNTLLDINQIEAGTVHAEIVDFPIKDLLDRLREEFAYHAQAQGLALRVVSSSLVVRSDPHLLEQMIRNLVSNALKYTKTGKVLLGCKRRGGKLCIEIWDTGIGIPKDELHAIFDEYHQLDNAARQRSLGLGLGLSIVQRLGGLLDHAVGVRSKQNKGSVFTIELALLRQTARQPQKTQLHLEAVAPALDIAHRTGTVLLIEDDPELHDLLELLLKDEGHQVLAATDGLAALAMMTSGALRPDVILSDFNLPKGMNGLETAAKLRERDHRETPVIILTGDISTETLRAIKLLNCMHLNKPVKVEEVTQAIQNILERKADPEAIIQTRTLENNNENPEVFIVDDDHQIRDTLRLFLEQAGHRVAAYASCEGFLAAYQPGDGNCLLVDAYLPGMTGLQLLRHLNEEGHHLPAIMITGNSDVAMAVEAMKTGASDFIEKPVGCTELLASVARAIDQSRDSNQRAAWKANATKSLAGLTARQHQIMDLVLAGHPNKNIAADLGISQRTVENHRASIMHKTASKSLPALARLALAAS